MKSGYFRLGQVNSGCYVIAGFIRLSFWDRLFKVSSN